MKTIILSLFLGISSIMMSQVGINTRTPTTMLDVNGTIRSRDLSQGLIQADADGNLLSGAPNTEEYTPFLLGTNNNPSFIPADALVYTTFDGNYSSTVTLPTALNSIAAQRIGTFIMIRKRSTFPFDIQIANTDLSAPLTLGSFTIGDNPTAIFMFDGYRWIFIKESQ